MLVGTVSSIAISMLLAVAVGCSASGDDLIVLKNGKRLTGKLESCLNGSCRLNDRAMPQAAIAWIGLAYGGHEPPGVKNPASDEVLTRSGAVESARLISINTSQVVTEARSYRRTDVAWIHLAQPLGGRPSGPESAIFHYDIVVKGHAQTAEKQTRVNDNRSTTVTLDWTTTFKDIAFKKVTAADQFMVLPVEGGEIKGGKTDVQYAFKFTYEGPLYTGPVCHGTANLESLDSLLLLSGGAGFDFDFETRLDPAASDQLADTMLNQAVDDCAKQQFKVYKESGEPFRPSAPAFPLWTSGDDTVAVVQGVTVERFILTLGVIARRLTTPGPLLSPVKEFGIGAGFSLSTGEVDRSYSCGDECNVEAMTELKMNVTPHH
ncbi:MAG: hypothetical protein JJE51_12295 [Thermoanaerobaculia bacterium]|nr:hypothetical protein [Thermoanaerobaculia bacterium]